MTTSDSQDWRMNKHHGDSLSTFLVHCSGGVLTGDAGAERRGVSGASSFEIIVRGEPRGDAAGESFDDSAAPRPDPTRFSSTGTVVNLGKSGVIARMSS